METPTPTNSGKQPDASNVLPSSQSSKETPTNLAIVRIPWNGTISLRRQKALQLIETDISTSTDDCNALEARLGHIPNVRKYDSSDFSWTHRSLVWLPSKESGSDDAEWDEDYLMYMCLDEKSGLPRNEYLEKLADFSDVTTYGDAFVFMMEPGLDVSDESGRAEYYHMDEEFVQNARFWKFSHSGQLLRKLLEKSTKEGKK